MAPTNVQRLKEQEAIAFGGVNLRGLGLASLRIVMGFIFFWAFIDKTFGLGYATKSANSWLNGGSPTRGFLSNAPKGPFQEFFNGLAGNSYVDGLFMLGLLGVGLALLLGIGMRIASYSGTLMVLLMWAAVLPPAQNPVLDDHIVYALVLLLLPGLGAGQHLGLGGWWSRQRLVQRFRILA